MNKYIIWPDWTLCEEEYLMDYLYWMGDDYILVEANSEQEALELAENIIH